MLCTCRLLEAMLTFSHFPDLHTGAGHCQHQTCIQALLGHLVPASSRNSFHVMSSMLRASLVQLPAGQRHGWPCVPWNRLMMVSSCPSWKPAAASSTTSSLSHASRPQARIPGRIRRTVAAPSALPAAAVSAAAAHPPWNTLAVLCSCAAAAQAAEDHTAWGRLLSAPLLTLLLALGAAALGLLPPTSPVYDVIWSHLMPMAVALLLLEHDVSNIRKAGGPVLVSFLLGAGELWDPPPLNFTK